MIAFCTRIQANPPTELQQAAAEADRQLSLRQSSLPSRDRLTHWIRFLNNQGREAVLHKQRAFDQRRPGELWAVEVGEVALFWWTDGSTRICYEPAATCSQRRIDYWLLHLVLPVYFACSGRFHFIHAGAVEAGGKAILFVADSLGGKSTLTDYFVRQGHALVSDDKVAVYESEAGFTAVPSYPYQRPYRRSEDLGRFVPHFYPRPALVGAVYELLRADPSAGIAFSELSGIEKFTSLYHAKDMNLSFLREASFDFVSGMAAGVPVYRVTLPWRTSRLEEVYDAVTRHAAGIEHRAC